MSDIEVFNFDQGTPEWHEVRMGIPTASEFDAILTGGKTRTTYLYKLAAEILTKESLSFSTKHTERGHEYEPAARAGYEFQTLNDVRQAGFIRNNKYGVGYSPDGLVGKLGAIEIKTKLPHFHIEVLKSDQVPAEHVPQCQGGMWVADLEWIDFVSYWPGLPLFVKRLYRDDTYIQRLSRAAVTFNDDLAVLVNWLKNYGNEEGERYGSN